MRVKYKAPTCPNCDIPLRVTSVLSGQGNKKILKNGKLSKLNIEYIDDGSAHLECENCYKLWELDFDENYRVIISKSEEE